jgi:hypothetical protein
MALGLPYYMTFIYLERVFNCSILNELWSCESCQFILTRPQVYKVNRHEEQQEEKTGGRWCSMKHHTDPAWTCMKPIFRSCIQLLTCSLPHLGTDCFLIPPFLHLTLAEIQETTTVLVGRAITVNGNTCILTIAASSHPFLCLLWFHNVPYPVNDR